MSQFFMKHCPICGRPLQIANKYKGLRVSCSHCCGPFVADSALNETENLVERATRLIDRVEMLLSSARRPTYGLESPITIHQPMLEEEVCC